MRRAGGVGLYDIDRKRSHGYLGGPVTVLILIHPLVHMNVWGRVLSGENLDQWNRKDSHHAYQYQNILTSQRQNQASTPRRPLSLAFASSKRRRPRQAFASNPYVLRLAHRMQFVISCRDATPAAMSPMFLAGRLLQRRCRMC